MSAPAPISRSEGDLTLVLGLGEVGRPLLELLARAHRVIGYDLEPADPGDRVSIMHVCYPAEVEGFVDVTRRYCERYRPRAVIIHSTVPVGTTADVQALVAVPVAHSPVRGKHARMGDDMLFYTKFFGIEDDGAAEMIDAHLGGAGFRTHRLRSTAATELAKLTETTYLGLLVAFAQDVDRMARSTGATYEEVSAFYEEIAYLPRTRFFPGIIGGHCVMPNIELLKQRYSSRLLDAIEWSNEQRSAEGGDPLPR